MSRYETNSYEYLEILKYYDILLTQLGFGERARSILKSSDGRREPRSKKRVLPRA
jgi:hypothetical protein